MNRDEEEIFAESMAKPVGPERSSYLDEACGGDAALRARIEVLLSAIGQAGEFLQAPSPGLSNVTDRADEIEHDRAVPSEGPGATVGPYKLLEQIGEGGMGVVYRAEQVRPVRREVALKIIKPGMDTRQVIDRFDAERQALAIMDHPGVAKVLDAGATAAGRPYFAMELVRGTRITDYCDQRQLAPRQRLALFVQVCRAVQHAHQKGIIHRDLKPSNILVTLVDGQAVPKVIDFGIAKAISGQRLTERTVLTELRQLIGTPLYMSPEQAELSAAADVDTRSDVYSLGVLLYELLTGTTPFDSKRLATAAYDEVRRIIREEEPPRPSSRLSTLAGAALTAVSARRQMDPKKLGQFVHGELDWIVMKALEKAKSRRYESASGLARDVERYLADEPVEACPPSRFYPLRKFARRNRAALAGAAVLLVVLALATAVSTWQAVRATRAQRQARQERDTAIAERERAARAAHTAHNVAHYLQDFISTANFGEAPQPPAQTVRQMLDQFSEQFESQLTDDPAAKAALHNIVGRGYHVLEDPEKVERHMSRAVELRRAAMEAQDTVYAGLVLRYAGFLREMSNRGTDRLAEAEALAREALAVYRTAGSKDGALNALRILRWILYDQGRGPEGDAVGDEWIKIARDTPSSVRVLELELGNLAMSRSDYAQAEAHFRHCIEVELRRPNGGGSCWIYRQLADALAAQHRFADALDAERASLAIFRRTRPPSHTVIGEMLDRITRTMLAARKASALRELFPSVEQIDEIELIYRESATLKPTRVPLDPATAAARGLSVLAQVCAELSDELAAAGETEKAARFREKANALARSGSTRPADDPPPSSSNTR